MVDYSLEPTVQVSSFSLLLVSKYGLRYMNLLPLGLKDDEATAVSGKHTSPPAGEVKAQDLKTAITIPVNTRNYLGGDWTSRFR